MTVTEKLKAFEEYCRSKNQRVEIELDPMGIIVTVKRGLRHRRSLTGWDELEQSRVNPLVERLESDITSLADWA